MKNLILFALISITASSCNLNSEKKEVITFKKSVSSIVTTSSNTTIKSKLTYNANNQINLVVKDDDHIKEDDIHIEYNEQGLISKLSHFSGEDLIRYKTIDWFTDSLHITKTIIDGSNSITEFRETYFYNNNKDMIGIDQYTKDSLGNWKIYGQKYRFIWENGNMIKILNYVSSGWEISDSTIINNETDDHLFDFDKGGPSRIDNNVFDLFYEATYKYDDKNNPYSNTSVSQLILPNEGNISKNNPVHIVKKYTSGETLDFKLEYEYNDLGFPTMTNIDLTTNVKGMETFHYTREFKY